MVVTALTGVAALMSAGAALYAVTFTRDQLDITRQGQITERFGRAIDQLGSDKLDVRLGGIYALERVMRDSAPDQPTIIEVLSAFVREHDGPVSVPAPTPTGRRFVVPTKPPTSDVQAALTVLGRRSVAHDAGRILDLKNTNLGRADLAGANLAGANLAGAYLTDADLPDADLAGANLIGAYAVRADLTRANLTGANLTGANLLAANLTDARLTLANVAGANLTEANLTGTDLTGAIGREAGG